jgi:hypothetical protein
MWSETIGLAGHRARDDRADERPGDRRRCEGQRRVQWCTDPPADIAAFAMLFS